METTIPTGFCGATGLTWRISRELFSRTSPDTIWTAFMWNQHQLIYWDNGEWKIYFDYDISYSWFSKPLQKVATNHSNERKPLVMVINYSYYKTKPTQGVSCCWSLLKLTCLCVLQTSHLHTVLQIKHSFTCDITKQLIWKFHKKCI